MTQQHPITPPPELVQQWWEESNRRQYTIPEAEEHVVSMAAQWGADQELEACIEWMTLMGYWGEDGKAIPALRAARRPKPPSLKEQALALINHDPANQPFLSDKGIDTIRRALEQLDD
jgi:hypothetical protein